MRELELAKHQSQYFMDYAEELQNELFRIQDETPEPELVAASIDG